MTDLWKLLLGLSPVVAVVLYFIMQQQAVYDKEAAYKEETFNLHVAEFDRDFTEDSIKFAHTKAQKKTLKLRAEEKDLEAQNIKFEREAAKQKKIAAKKRAEKELAEIDKEVANVKEEDFDF